MKDSLLEIIVCPICHSPFELKNMTREEKEILSGSLYCIKCNHIYTIIDGIPNLLPPNINV